MRNQYRRARIILLLLVATFLFGSWAVRAWVVVPSHSRRRIRKIFRTTRPAVRVVRRSSYASLHSSSSEHETTTTQVTTSPPAPPQQQLNAQQYDFIVGYMNKHHRDLLTKWAATFSLVGQEMAQANVFSGGSYTILVDTTQLVDITLQSLTLHVQIQRRGKQQAEERSVVVDLDEPVVFAGRRRRRQALPPPVALLQPRFPIDELVRKLVRLCWMVDDDQDAGKAASVTGKLVQLALQLDGAGIGKLPENMYLNQVPHNRYVRQWFYDKASKAILDAVILCSQGRLPNTMQVISMFPETNPSMDSYRIGTILELIRDAAITLAEQNLRVRVCVQASMGVGIFVGVPKQLNGVSKLLQLMDWQSGPGEVNEGMVGSYVNFGAIGAEHVQNEVRSADGTTIVQHRDDVFLLIAPQSMVGTDSSILPFLQEHVRAAGDRPVILFNPDLTDKISAAGQQSVRGRQERLDFAAQFQTIFHFQNIYVSGTSYFPILGAITKLHPEEPWVCHQRRDFVENGGEIYVPVLAGETKPEGEIILATFER